MSPTDSQNGLSSCRGDSVGLESASIRRPWRSPILQAVDIKDITGSGTFSGNDFAGRMMMAMSSDRRVKRDIQRVGVTPSGLPVYVFRYLSGEALWLGTMAQDVLPTHPHAVMTNTDGMLSVDYAAIDVPFGRV